MFHALRASMMLPDRDMDRILREYKCERPERTTIVRRAAASPSPRRDDTFSHDDAGTYALPRPSYTAADAKGESEMKTARVICFVLATLAGTSLLPATPSYALEYPNQAQSCAVVGNCRHGDNRTSEPLSMRQDRFGVGRIQSRSSAAGHTKSGGHSKSGGKSGPKR
jgi:hypothetical protein